MITMIPKPPLHTYELLLNLHMVDASGTIFVGRAFEVAHACLAEFLAAANLGLDRMIRGEIEVAPIVHARCDFRAPTRVGERLVVELRCEKIGDTSFTLEFRACVNGEIRFIVSQVHVVIDAATKQPVSVPVAIRQALASPHAKA